MADDSIPPEVRDFILKHIDSVAQLEALLLLYWEKSTDWTAAKLAKRLYIGEPAALSLLARLSADGLATESENRYVFNSKNPDLDKLLDEVANAYSTRLIPITNLIHAKPARIREFSDAFRFRKDRT
jgi:hypothetical protein